MELQKNYLNRESVQTIYFGGGTPSAIPAHLIGELIEQVQKIFPVIERPEITLEANPDDLTLQNLSSWKRSGVNRLSVGVQSFVDDHLVWMNRAHTNTQALDGLRLAQDLGITNITMDLIYGIPDMKMNQWEENIRTFIDLDLSHLSAYGLTIEPNTHLGYLAKTKQLNVTPDSSYNKQFEVLMDAMESKGFEHYEISNFGQPNLYSQHNTSYWLGKKYVGIGPSAHSYNGNNREWNVSSNMKYLKSIEKGIVPSESELLSSFDTYNEYILTRLRTKWGIDPNQIKEQFGSTFQNNLNIGIKPYIDSGHVEKQQENFVLTRAGKFIADKISSDLFMID